MEVSQLIQEFWAMKKEGIPLYKKDFTEKATKMEEGLVAGFFSAMSHFMEEIMEGEIKQTVIHQQKLTYLIVNDLMFVIISGEKDNNAMVMNGFRETVDAFTEKFRTQIEKFEGEVSVFKSFDENIEKIIGDRDYQLICASCGKIIEGEYFERQIGGRLFYFCCRMCMKHFEYDDNMDSKTRMELENMRLHCSQCGRDESIPMHCNKPMHHEIINGKDKLVCWMGVDCGVIDIPHHCSKPMKVEYLEPTKKKRWKKIFQNL